MPATSPHRTRSFGSNVTVTSHKSGRSITARVTDRGPFVTGRYIDLSTAQRVHSEWLTLKRSRSAEASAVDEALVPTKRLFQRLVM
jgi:Lytic transglycolase